MVVIKLKRMGAKKNPFYRIVVTDSRNRVAAKYIDQIGYYDPKTDPPTLQVDEEKLAHWKARGAQISETVESLVRRQKHESVS